MTYCQANGYFLAGFSDYRFAYLSLKLFHYKILNCFNQKYLYLIWVFNFNCICKILEALSQAERCLGIDVLSETERGLMEKFGRRRSGFYCL